MSKPVVVIKREPVVVQAVVSIVALLAAVGVNPSSDVVNHAINATSVAVWVWGVVRNRSKVTPVG